jgi:hypothetical protein
VDSPKQIHTLRSGILQPNREDVRARAKRVLTRDTNCKTPQDAYENRGREVDEHRELVDARSKFRLSSEFCFYTIYPLLLESTPFNTHAYKLRTSTQLARYIRWFRSMDRLLLHCFHVRLRCCLSRDNPLLREGSDERAKMPGTRNG